MGSKFAGVLNSSKTDFGARVCAGPYLTVRVNCAVLTVCSEGRSCSFPHLISLSEATQLVNVGLGLEPLGLALQTTQQLSVLWAVLRGSLG